MVHMFDFDAIMIPGKTFQVQLAHLTGLRKQDLKELSAEGNLLGACH